MNKRKDFQLYLFGLLLTLLGGLPVWAMDLHLTWDLNPEPDMGEYRVYIVPVNDPYEETTFKRVPHPSHELLVSLDAYLDGTYKVRLRAVDTTGNVSEPSEEIQFTKDTKPPGAPKNVRTK